MVDVSTAALADKQGMAQLGVGGKRRSRAQWYKLKGRKLKHGTTVLTIARCLRQEAQFVNTRWSSVGQVCLLLNA
jgi:hypothetical protein